MEHLRNNDQRLSEVGTDYSPITEVKKIFADVLNYIKK